MRSNTFSLVAARLVSAAAGLIVSVMVARRLGVGDFGSYVAVVAGAFVANTLVTFGTDTLVVRDVARHEASPEVGASLGLQLLVAAPIAVAAAIVVGLWGDQAAPLGVAAVGLIPGVWATTAIAVLRGRERMDLAAVATSAGSLSAVGGTVVAAAADAGISMFVAAVVGGQIVGAAVASVLARRESAASWRPTLDLSTWRRAAPFAVMVGATAIAAGSGVLALEFLGTEAATGQYGAANRLSEGLRLLPAAVFGAAFPAMARGVHRRPDYRREVRTVMAGTVALAALTIAVAGSVVGWLFGDFAETAATLRVLALGLIPLTLRLRWSFELIAEGGEAIVARLAVVAALVTVALVSLAATSGPTLVAAAGVTALTIHAALLLRWHRRSVATPV